MKPIKEIEYIVPQEMKERAKKKSIEEQTALYEFTVTPMEKNGSYSSVFTSAGKTRKEPILNSDSVKALLVCNGILVGISLNFSQTPDINMYFDANKTHMHYSGSSRSDGDYYGFISYADCYRLTYIG